MSETYFHRLHELTPTRGWINNPTRQEAEQALEAGITNCTTNPTFTMKQIQREPDLMNPVVDRICSEESDDNRAAALIQRECVGHLIKIFQPVFDARTRMEGLVSLQGDPILEEDSGTIIEEALEARKLGANFLAKVPTTRAGIEAVEVLIREDVPVITTEIMSLSQIIAVCETYNKVSAECGKTPPLFVTHITGIFDDYVHDFIERNSVDISPDIAFQAGTVVARKLYQLFHERKYPGILVTGGARGLHHFTEFVGGEMGITINWKNMAETLIAQNTPVIERINTPTPEYIVRELLEKIPDFRLAWENNALQVDEFEGYGPVHFFRKSFIKGWEFLLDEVRKRR